MDWSLRVSERRRRGGKGRQNALMQPEDACLAVAMSSVPRLGANSVGFGTSAAKLGWNVERIVFS